MSIHQTLNWCGSLTQGLFSNTALSEVIKIPWQPDSERHATHCRSLASLAGDQLVGSPKNSVPWLPGYNRQQGRRGSFAKWCAGPTETKSNIWSCPLVAPVSIALRFLSGIWGIFLALNLLCEMGLNVIKLIAGLGGVFGMGPDMRDVG